MGGGGGGKKGGGKFQVHEYYMSVHYGVCLGEVDEVTQIQVFEKDIGLKTGVKSTGYVDVRNDGLFGGRKEGGGVNGRIHFLFGKPDQKMAPELARRLVPNTGTPDNVPGFRGYLSLFFTGKDGISNWSKNSKKGFIWGCNYPQLHPVAVQVRRRPRGLDDNSLIGPDANPAHIIWECLVNPSWGLGYPEAMLDRDAFLAAAATLRAEEFGLSLMWTRQTKIEAFITEILDHISATIATDPFTGKLYIKLLRDDYDVDTLFEVSPDNADLSRYQRNGWGETVNEITVTWTNPENEQEETVTAHDNANIAIQGQVVGDSRNYYAVRKPDLAMRLATRDVRAAGTALVSCDAELNRSAWGIRPGDVVNLTWPEHGVTRVTMRVGAVNYGKPGAPKIRVSLLQDIFGFADSMFEPPATKWVDPGTNPSPLDHLYLGGAPYFVVAALAGDEYAQAMEYPAAYAMLLAAQDKVDTHVTEFLSERADITGNIGFFPAGSVNNQGRGTLGGALAIEVASDIHPLRGYTGSEPFPGMIVMICDALSPDDHELAAIESVSESSIIVRRGVLDTIPREWSDGATVWVVDVESRIVDKAVRSIGEVPRYKFLPSTSRSQLTASEAPIDSGLVDDRQYLPYRPANVRLDGKLYGPTTVRRTGMMLTWSRRNRFTETSQVHRWTAADVAPEEGQTTTVEICQFDTVLQVFEGLTGTDCALDLLAVPGLVTAAPALIRVYSMRDGFRSRATVDYEIYIAEDVGGYGRNYSVGYGGVSI